MEELSEIVGRIAPKYQINAVYLYGSRARGDNRRNSDYDLMLEIGPGFRLFDLFDFEDEMKAVLKREVQAITDESLRTDNRFSRGVLKDRIKIYG